MLKQTKNTTKCIKGCTITVDIHKCNTYKFCFSHQEGRQQLAADKVQEKVEVRGEGVLEEQQNRAASEESDDDDGGCHNKLRLHCVDEK